MIDILGVLPQGFSTRPPRMEDADAVAAFWTEHNSALGEAPGIDADELRMYWGDPTRNLDDDNLLMIAPDGRIAAVLDLYEYPPYITWEFEGAVHPDFTGLGIGSCLV